MISHSTIKRHATLMDRMADAVGVDLEESILRGALTPAELSDAVLRCTACSNPDHCDGWLGDHAPADSPALSYCRNRALFESLRAKSG